MDTKILLVNNRRAISLNLFSFRHEKEYKDLYLVIVIPMSYTLFLLPNTVHNYPEYVISLLDYYKESAFVITLDKRWLYSLNSDVYYLERTNKENKTVSNFSITKEIRQKQPQLVVLDNCFCDNRNNLLEDIMTLQKEIPFQLLNVEQMNDVRYSEKHAEMDEATKIYVPEWKNDRLTNLLRFSESLSPKLEFYGESEMRSIVYGNS